MTYILLTKTFKFVARLEQQGFKRATAETILGNLNISEPSSVKRVEFDKLLYSLKVDFSNLKSEIQLLEKNEFQLLKSDLARLNTALDKSLQRNNEELRRISTNVRLELMGDKSVLRDEQSQIEFSIKQTQSKIDTEISHLKTNMSTIQWDLFRSLFPIFSAAGALTFSYLRFIN